MTREHRHRVLARKLPVAERVAGTVRAAVVVEVEPARHACVRRSDEAMRELDRLLAVLRDTEVVLREHARRLLCVVAVEFAQQQHVDVVALNDLGDLARLVAAIAQLLQHCSGIRAIHRRVEARDAHGRDRGTAHVALEHQPRERKTESQAEDGELAVLELHVAGSLSRPVFPCDVPLAAIARLSATWHGAANIAAAVSRFDCGPITTTASFA